MTWIRNKLPGMEVVIINTDDIVSIDTVFDEEIDKHILLVALKILGTINAIKLAEGNFSEINLKVEKLLKLMKAEVSDL